MPAPYFLNATFLSLLKSIGRIYGKQETRIATELFTTLIYWPVFVTNTELLADTFVNILSKSN